MNWLNINLTTLRSPAYIGSGPVQRATWLQVLAYCADQENGGRIRGAAAWKDRQWQQTCGVTAREVRASGKLITFHRRDVRVAFYPLDKEALVISNREAGRRGGSSCSEQKARAARENGLLGGRPPSTNGRPRRNSAATPPLPGLSEPSSTTAPASEPAPICPISPISPICPIPPAPQQPPATCTPAAAIAHAATLIPPCPEHWALKWWEDSERRGWVDRENIPIRKWRPALSSYWRGVQETDRRNLALQTTRPHAYSHHTHTEAHRDTARTGLPPRTLHLRRIEAAPAAGEEPDAVCATAAWRT